MSSRFIDKKILQYVRELPCCVCRRAGAEPHHIKTRGAGGPDRIHNLIPLCKAHHTGPQGWHKLGRFTFLKKFPAVKILLISKGWQINEEMAQMFHPLNESPIVEDECQ